MIAATLERRRIDGDAEQVVRRGINVIAAMYGPRKLPLMAVLATLTAWLVASAVACGRERPSLEAVTPATVING
jgi:hypothetical protein